MLNKIFKKDEPTVETKHPTIDGIGVEAVELENISVEEVDQTDHVIPGTVAYEQLVQAYRGVIAAASASMDEINADEEIGARSENVQVELNGQASHVTTSNRRLVFNQRNWNERQIVTASDINRWEQGIAGAVELINFLYEKLRINDQVAFAEFMQEKSVEKGGEQNE